MLNTLAIIFPNDDGGISICYPLDASRGAIEVTPQGLDDATDPPTIIPAVTRPETDAEFALRIAHKDVPSGLPFRFVALADIPADRTDRDLWSADFTTPDGIAGQS